MSGHFSSKAQFISSTLLRLLNEKSRLCSASVSVHFDQVNKIHVPNADPILRINVTASFINQRDSITTEFSILY